MRLHRFAGALGICVLLVLPHVARSATWSEGLIHVFGSSFGDERLDGRSPSGKLTVDASGNLFGVTTYGGGVPFANAKECTINGGGCGAVFELSPPAAGSTYWTETDIYSFTGGVDAEFPVGGLVADASGMLYGAANGRTGNTQCTGGCVFALAPSFGVESVIHRWPTEFGGGQGVNGDLIVGSGGTLYGTTQWGGKNNAGTIFKLTPPGPGGSAWTHRELYAFTGGADGRRPNGGLLVDARGALYGTTILGGSSTNNCDFNGLFSGATCGVIFKLAQGAPSDRWVETVLYSFGGKLDGAHPSGGLVAGASGALYGTTAAGGRLATFDLSGVAFALAPAANGALPWTLKTLHTFGGAGDGSEPTAGLLPRAKIPTFFGTTVGGGRYGVGTAYRLTRGSGGWSESVLYSFNANAGASGDGYQPNSSLVAYGRGALFGMAPFGGPYTGAFFPYGTVFELSER